MDDRLFEIIMALLFILCTIITRYIVPYIKSKIGTENLSKYEYWVNVAVKAAELIWVESGHGADKKQYVIDFMNKMFNSKKTVITEEQMNALIEAAVKQLKISENK